MPGLELRSTSALSDLPLVLAWGTLRVPFLERVAAAAAGGFHWIGLMVREYLALRRSGWTDEELRRVLDEHSVAISEVEVLFGFAAPAATDPGIVERPGLIYNDPELEQAAFHMADVFGVGNVQAAGMFTAPPAPPDVAAAFGALCDRAAEHRMQVALEFVPYTDIPDVAAAAAIVAAADRPNGGLCVDSWHFFRGTPDFAALSAVPAERITMIQINDGPLEPEDSNRRRDAVHNRRLPGNGEFDLVRWLEAMDRPGLAATVSIEVYADSLVDHDPAEVATRALTTTRAVLGRSSRPEDRRTG